MTDLAPATDAPIEAHSRSLCTLRTMPPLHARGDVSSRGRSWTTTVRALVRSFGSIRMLVSSASSPVSTMGLPVRWVGAMGVCCVLNGVASGCASSTIPSPRATLDEYSAAAKKGDSRAIYELMSERSRQAMGREGVERAVGDARSELAEQAGAATSPGARVEASAKVRFRDGEEATLELEDGIFRVSSADALPAGAKTPAQALDQLRTVLARRSYAGLMRVLSKETRRAIEQDFRSLVEGLERPEGLDVKVQGDKATVQVSGGHLVRLKRENGLWRIEDFD